MPDPKACPTQKHQVSFPDPETLSCLLAGNQLFQVVVDNDETASKIIGYMNRGKLGRANFMPLNRLHTQEVHYNDYGTDVVPLLKKLKFNPAFTPAMKQVCLWIASCGVV